MPIPIVECDGLRDLLSLIEPWYRMASHDHILLLLHAGVNILAEFEAVEKFSLLQLLF